MLFISISIFFFYLKKLLGVYKAPTSLLSLTTLLRSYSSCASWKMAWMGFFVSSWSPSL